jgi:hypothetical protein
VNERQDWKDDARDTAAALALLACAAVLFIATGAIAGAIGTMWRSLQ